MFFKLVKMSLEFVSEGTSVSFDGFPKVGGVILDGITSVSKNFVDFIKMWLEEISNLFTNITSVDWESFGDVMCHLEVDSTGGSLVSSNNVVDLVLDGIKFVLEVLETTSNIKVTSLVDKIFQFVDGLSIKLLGLFGVGLDGVLDLLVDLGNLVCFWEESFT